MELSNQICALAKEFEAEIRENEAQLNSEIAKIE